MTNFIQNIGDRMKTFTWCSIPSPMVIDAIACSGITPILDLEHGVFNWETIASIMHSFSNIYVRINYPIDEREINWAIEFGVKGIFVPHTESIEVIERVEDVISNKGLSPYTKRMEYGIDLSPKNIKFLNDMSLNSLEVIYMIEGDGVKYIDTFVQERYIPENKPRSLYVGVYDLSKYVGEIGNITHQKVVSTLNGIIFVANKNCLKVGTYARNKKDAKFWTSKTKIDFLAIGSDIGVITQFYKNL